MKEKQILYAFFMWELLLAVSVVTFALSTLLQRMLLKSNQTASYAFAIFFQLLTGIVLSVFACIHGFSLSHATQLIPNMLLSIGLYAVMIISIFTALTTIEASQFIIFFATRAFWIICAAVFFLKESFSFIQLFGTLRLICSIILISFKQKKLHFTKGTLLSLLAAACFGFAFTNDAYIVRTVDVISYQALSFLTAGLCILAFYPKAVKQMKPLFTKQILLKLIVLSLLYATSVITILFAYQVGRNAAQLGALAQTTTIVTVLLSISFLKETANLGKKLLGTLLAFLGVVLIG